MDYWGGGGGGGGGGAKGMLAPPLKLLGGPAPPSSYAYVNSDIFKIYMYKKDLFFFKYVEGGDGEPMLVLYDGHHSHIALALVEWACDKNIILFVLPQIVHHILQPMDIGCFSLLQVARNA